MHLYNCRGSHQLEINPKETIREYTGGCSGVRSKTGTGVKRQNKGIDAEGEEGGKALGVPVLEMDSMAK